MRPGEPAAPGLIVHVFVAAAGPEAVAGERRLRQVWDALGDRLHMPATTVGTVEVRTARGLPLRQAVLRLEHDMRCLSVALTGGSWKELDALWAGCAGEDIGEWALGECRLFVAYGRTRRADRIVAALPQPYTTPQPYSTSRMTTRDGLALWEVGHEEDARSRRVFAVIAPRRLETRLDAWAWTAGDDRMAPFTRYLMHAAKVRYYLRVYADGASMRAARSRVDEQVDATMALLGGDGLTSARRELTERQTAAAGLIWAATRLREMRRSVEIALHNMRAQGLEDDLALTEWFLRRLDDDLAYAEAARERAREITAIADIVLAERLQLRAEKTERRWERFGVLSTAVIGSLIMMLTAVQSLNYRVPLPDSVKPFIVAALALTAFGVTAFGVVRWRRSR
ncbi:CATRA conflict system CASPASE/TPR repeat-associated protein [Nonomuraea sp. NPDC049028]|uniref:CATRA conflict system CASPASE/TPR repeat-associated protein n=1 Tax=Nonomuraea sp. NPDC049028 TaxID=3364348 RepID=UPI003713D9D9